MGITEEVQALIEEARVDARDAVAYYQPNPKVLLLDAELDLIKMTKLITRLADALSATLPREVETVEELDALPLRSVVQDKDGGLFERGHTRVWDTTGSRSEYTSDEIVLPARVLFTPPQNGEER